MYYYYEIGVEEPVAMTEQAILMVYWDFWYDKMVKKYGKDSELINAENCIKDWAVVNWAWKDE